MKRIFLTAVALASPALSQEMVGAWQFREVVDPLSDASRGIANTASGNDIAMIVKCDSNGNNKLYVSFLPKKHLGRSRNKRRPIAYRVDDSPARSILGIYDTRTADIVSVGLFNDAGHFLKEVAAGSQLIVRITDYQSRVITATIDIHGARDAISRVATTCKDNSMLRYLEK